MKYHLIAAGSALCGRREPELSTHSVEEFRGQLRSDRCDGCERKLGRLFPALAEKTKEAAG